MKYDRDFKMNGRSNDRNMEFKGSRLYKRMVNG